MLPDRVSNPGPLTYESGALPIALRGPANMIYDIIGSGAWYTVYGMVLSKNICEMLPEIHKMDNHDFSQTYNSFSNNSIPVYRRFAFVTFLLLNGV